MRLCAQCGYITDNRDGLCAYHVRDDSLSSIHGDSWAAGNRIMCDFVHRGVVEATTASTQVNRKWRSAGAPATGSGRLTS